MVLNSTVMFISMSISTANHILQIVIWAQGNRSFMWPSQVNMGSDWALQSHSNLLMCEQEHFTQEPPMFQMWILSTPQPHSLQLPSFWVSPESLLWADCTLRPPNFHWRYISVAHCIGDLPHPLSVLKKTLEPSHFCIGQSLSPIRLNMCQWGYLETSIKILRSYAVLWSS